MSLSFSRIIADLSESSVMKGCFALLLLMTTCSWLLKAQTTTAAFNGAEVSIGYGVHRLDVNSFNRNLASHGLPAQSRQMSGVSVGGGVFVKRIFFGGQAGWHYGAGATEGNYKTTMSGGNGMLKAGYVLTKSESFAFYPSIGVGGGGISYQASDISRGQDSERPVFVNRSLHSAYMIVDPEINADFFIGKRVEGKSKLLLGISTGYMLSPVISTWESGKTKYPDLTKFAPEGLYVRIRAGLYISTGQE